VRSFEKGYCEDRFLVFGNRLDPVGERGSSQDREQPAVEVEKEGVFEGGVRSLGEIKLKQDVQVLGDVVSASSIELERRISRSRRLSQVFQLGLLGDVVEFSSEAVEGLP
jgi:hypothetical protein